MYSPGRLWLLAVTVKKTAKASVTLGWRLVSYAPLATTCWEKCVFPGRLVSGCMRLPAITETGRKKSYKVLWQLLKDDSGYS